VKINEARTFLCRHEFRIMYKEALLHDQKTDQWRSSNL